MAVTVTDTRTVITQADDTTNWTGAGGTSTSIVAEASAAVVSTINTDTDQVYFTTTARDVSDTLIYIWSNNFAQQGSWDDAEPPNAMHLGDNDGDRVSFKIAGANRKVFAHLDAGTGITSDWDCLVLDGSQASTLDTAGNTVERAGTFAGLDLTNITIFGSDFTTQSKGLGGGVNVAVDIIRIGNDGLVITGGATGGTEGKFSEIVLEDRSTADLKAHGIIREYSTGIYGCQGPLTWGEASTGDTWFEDEDVVVVFENRDIGDDKYYLAVREPSISDTTTFILRNSTVTTAGPNITGTFNNTGITTLTITGCNFANWGNAITFANDAATSGHTVTGNTFTACGQIDPGTVTFQNNTIQASTASATGALLLDADGTSNWSGLDFVFGTSGHAIYITATGTYSFTNFTYSGYGGTPGSNLVSSSGSTDAMVFNDSGGAVTINVTGGDSPSVRNGASATTTVNANQSLDIHVQDAATDPIQNAVVAVYDSSDTEIANELTDASGDINTASVQNGASLYIRVRKSTTGTRYVPLETTTSVSGDVSLTITLTEDLIAS